MYRLLVEYSTRRTSVHLRLVTLSGLGRWFPPSASVCDLPFSCTGRWTPLSTERPCTRRVRLTVNCLSTKQDLVVVLHPSELLLQHAPRRSTRSAQLFVH